jgi:hypothetical protein
VIDNVTYDYQGDYECRATNFISGQARTTSSDPISLQVVGAPQVLRPEAGYHVLVKRGESAILTLVVCADPRPRHVAWEWGSLRLEAGHSIGKKKRFNFIVFIGEKNIILSLSNVNKLLFSKTQVVSALMMLFRIIARIAILPHCTLIKLMFKIRDHIIWWWRMIVVETDIR